MKKIIVSFLVLSLLLSAQFAYAGGGGGGGGKSGGSVGSALSSAWTAVTDVANDVTNVIVGGAEAAYGATLGAINSISTDLGMNPLTTQGYVQGLETDGENRIDNGFSNTGIIAGDDQIGCSTPDSTTYVGGPAVSWVAKGGANGEEFILTSPDMQNGSMSGMSDSPNGGFSFNNVIYTSPGVVTAAVSASFGNRSDGIYACSGSITVLPASENPGQGNNGGSTNNNPTTGSPTTPTLPSGTLPTTVVLGSSNNPIVTQALCIPSQGNATGTLFVNQDTTWNLSLVNLDFSQLSNVSIGWQGTDLEPSTTTVASISNIYTTVGEKTLEANLTGSNNGVYFSATCMATTTMYLQGGTVTNI